MLHSPRLCPRYASTPAFRAAQEAFQLLVPVAASLPPEFRYLSAHLRRRGTLVLVGLSVSAGQSGKQKRNTLRLVRVMAFDITGALHAAAVVPGAQELAIEQVSLAYLRLVRRLAPFV